MLGAGAASECRYSKASRVGPGSESRAEARKGFVRNLRDPVSSLFWNANGAKAMRSQAPRECPHPGGANRRTRIGTAERINKRGGMVCGKS